MKLTGIPVKGARIKDGKLQKIIKGGVSAKIRARKNPKKRFAKCQ